MNQEKLQILAHRLLTLSKLSNGLFQQTQYLLYVSEGDSKKLTASSVASLNEQLEKFKNYYTAVIEAIEFEDVQDEEAVRFIQQLKEQAAKELDGNSRESRQSNITSK